MKPSTARSFAATSFATTLATTGALLATAVLATQCGTGRSRARAAADPAAVAAFNVVYQVLQHPRCANCHPAGDVPLQGDDRRAHLQNVQRGAEGMGRYALRCNVCHGQQNLPGAHLPPGVPGWRMPTAAMPMVFVGKSQRELAEQLADPARNGGRSPEQLLEHATRDPLVLWGWNPGNDRAPVPIAHAEFVAAMKTWIEHGCGAPDR